MVINFLKIFEIFADFNPNFNLDEMPDSLPQHVIRQLSNYVMISFEYHKDLWAVKPWIALISEF